ncbi:phage head closure protein [Vreelandella profundi]|uniref:phage head closure protein n=1 Tax=Vreelandella profundi TaxID=2852117 RepID=UPI001F0102CD|nr:phage head closure protein [Halomonas profundi]
MRTGRLRHRCTIERPGEDQQDPSTGAMIKSWEEVGKAWMAIEPLSARAFIAAQAAQSEVTGQLVMRYRPNLQLDSTMRVRHSGKIYNIEGVLPDNESGREHITLPYSEGLNDG